MNIGIFCFICRVTVCFTILLSRGLKKNNFISKRLSGEPIVLSSKHWRVTRKCNLSSFLDVEHPFSPKKCSMLSSRSQSKVFNMWQSIPLKSFWSSSLHPNFDSAKTANSFDLSRYSNSRFFVTTGLLFSIIRNIIRKMETCRAAFDNSHSFWSFHQKFVTTKNPKVV